MIKKFTVQPKHWWQWLSIRWWRNRKLLQAMLNYYDPEIEKRIEDAIRDSILYGGHD